jgi:hypothetical protein
VTLQVRSVDRLFLQGYVPRLQTQGQLIRFLLDRGFPIPSPAALGKIGRGYAEAINRFIVEHEIPVVRFRKGEVKELIAREYFQRAERQGRYGVVLVGVAQEKTSAWRGWRDGGPDGHPHFEYRRRSIFPGQLLLLHPRPRLGPDIHQDGRLGAVLGLGLSQRQRMGQAAGRPPRARVHGVGQRLRRLPGPGGLGRDLPAALGR